MKIGELIPCPVKFETFKRNRERYIPGKPGCYVLTNFSRDVLYIGLTVSLRRRINEHLDNPEKTLETRTGRAVLFFWIEVPESEINKIERTWLNIHIQHAGVVPILNKMYSPVSA
jgi:excinuclease UvrABC nuclease subunit